MYVELGREFHVVPWAFENAPFRWYRRLRLWFFWKRHKDWEDLPQEVRDKIELERQADKRIATGWDDELFQGEFV